MNMVEFGSLFRFIRNGMNIKQDKSGEGLPITRIETIADARVDSSRVGYAGLKESDCPEWMMEPGDILFSHINSVEHIGKCAVYYGTPEKLVHGMNLLCLRCDTKKLLPEFAKYLIRSPAFRARLSNFINKAVNQASVSIGNLKTIPVSVPSLEEQKKIADILDRAEALRTKRRAALEQLNELTQAIFIDMFGDPVANPKGWQTIECANICERITVGIVVKPASYYVPSGVPALRSLNIKPGYISLEDLVYFSEHDNNTKLAKTKLKTGDLVIVRTGQPGTSSVVPADLDGINAIDLLIATPKPDIVNSVFLSQFFNSSGGRSIVLTAQRGQVQKHLNVGSLNESCIPLPPIELQKEFSRRVSAVEKLKTAHKSSLAELDELFASLQYRAFRGEL
ncbi:restriction endonuclease subunit S [Methanosarcina mazei]|uniref:Restriction endonuclease subunit S n=4 Tax=Methanosarcina mazei TaxID=2209 RepID=A0A0F8JVR0_METMZ|nr:restriction endonuclease subunit S [Methanosarcina mazei]AKB40633.1 Type I restriction-modification system, specificity subunit S [Methanosarcina mazei WWM610]AKB61609.1 Type I restriction-modification system, specificity subunit S [Methanosarcina mazei SarPi]AKB72942.1 Type I restriction-modification system, specificity subunit S [Methanosarcina mazei C16]KKG00830.1 hypothetical protein DU47_14205 [Methanosarcina mazei]KKG03202.1 hypothetical protein DU31_13655 [Methanosarcina mazei]